MTLPKITGVRGWLDDPKVLRCLEDLSRALNPSGDLQGPRLLALFLCQKVDEGTLTNIAINPNFLNHREILLALKETCEDNLNVLSKEAN